MKVDYKFNFDQGKCKDKYSGYSKQAQRLLKNEIVKDTDKFVPSRNMSGGFASSAIQSISSNTDAIVYRGPYARFLYHGKVMVGIRTNRPWAKQGEVKKVTEKNLTFGGAHPLACARWFEKSKSINLNKWLTIAKKVFKDGR